MKGIFISLVFSIALTLISSAQSGSGTATDPFFGTISTSVIWDLSNFPSGAIYVGKVGTPSSTYNDLTVNSGGHLTIGPGITVIFLLTTSDLIITGSGIITASGSSSSSVVFTKDPSISHWGHISFEIPGSPNPITGTGSFSFCRVEYGYAATSGTNPDNAGGAIQVNASNVTITNCLFQNNYSNFGGAVTVNASRNTIINSCYFKSNTANEAGGAVLLWTNSTALVENCIFDQNLSRGTSYNLYSGGAIWILSNSSVIVNCTFVRNLSNRPGGALFSYTSPSAKIINSIFWGSNDQFAAYGTPAALTYCAFQSVKPASALNSIILNSNNNAPDGPNFTSTDGTDWSIQYVSPCRNAGTTVGAPSIDYLGKTRNVPYDMGAYEVIVSIWKTTASTTDWTNAANWDGGVPSSANDVVIPTGATNYPISTPAPNFTLDAGFHMTLGPGAKTTLGSFTNNGSLILQSDATSGSASFIVNSYSGNDATIEVFLTGGEAGGTGTKTFRWHYISTPIPSLPVSTFVPTYTTNLAKYWDDRVAGSLTSGWVKYSGYVYSTTAIDPVRQFTNLLPGIGYDYYAVQDNKISFTGQLNTSDVTMSLSYAVNDALHGFNLLGNPFSSGLDWSVINSDPSYPLNTSKTVYFTRDNTQCSFVGGVGIPSDVTGIIPPMQGFFVKTYSAGNSLKIPASARVQNAIHSRYKGDVIVPLVRLSITENLVSDETVVRFDAAAKSGLDYDYDAVKMFISSTSTQIYSSMGGVNYSINGLPYPDSSIVIPIVVNFLTGGNHSINVTQLQGLDNYSVTLTDKSTGFIADLKSTPILSFSADAGTLADRFVLTISTITTLVENPVTAKGIFNIYPSFGSINIQTLADDWEGKSGSIKVQDLSGKIVGTLDKVTFSKNSLTSVPANFTKGLYFVELKSGLKRYVGKVVIR
jgi:hypothetical protein